MFPASMGRFQLELNWNCLFAPSSHSIIVFFPVGLSLFSRYFSKKQKKFRHPKRPVENAVRTTKGLHEGTQLLNGMTVKKGNSNLILIRK